MNSCDKLTKLEKIYKTLYLAKRKLEFIKHRPSLLFCKEFLLWDGEGYKKSLQFWRTTKEDFEFYCRPKLIQKIQGKKL